MTVYESGMTGDRPYFAMQYVRGRPLDRHVREHKPGLEETLRLFQKVCGAVNHAHQRGVIHRDLKPANVLIDGEGEPHVLDFGLAKAAGAGLTGEGRPVTETGQFLGTLAYASPEQTKGDPGLIDIRTDVYGLGVMLYEALTGQYPYEVAGEPGEVLRNIAQAEPRKPSTIRRQIGDEVETIALKALSKDKERRYQSAGALAEDIGRYLAGEAIEAKRDSGWYVLKKTVGRYRLPLFVAAGFLVLSCLFAVAMALQARRIAAERDQAERQGYIANIRAAESSLKLNQASEAKRRLDLCPARLRGWEWDYLNNRTDLSLLVLEGHEGYVSDASFSPDGRRIASASRDATVRIWDAETGKLLEVLRGHEGRIHSVAFSPDGRRIVSASFSGSVLLWDVETAEVLLGLHKILPWVSFVAFDPTGERIFASGYEGLAILEREPVRRHARQ